MKLISNNIKNSLTYSVIGLPESGATSVGEIMNRIDGSICMIDPIKNIHSTNMDVIDNITTRQVEIIKEETDNFINGYQRFIKGDKSKFRIGGIKEDYSPIPSILNRETNKIIKKSDFIIFIISDPKSNFSRWKFSRFTKDGKLNPNYRLNYNMYIKMYENYIKKYHEIKMIKPTFLIKIEELINNHSSNFLNNIFKGSLEFDGDISNDVEFPSTSHLNLTNLEIKEIDYKLDEIYKNIRGYGYY